MAWTFSDILRFAFVSLQQTLVILQVFVENTALLLIQGSVGGFVNGRDMTNCFRVRCAKYQHSRIGSLVDRHYDFEIRQAGIEVHAPNDLRFPLAQLIGQVRGNYTLRGLNPDAFAVNTDLTSQRLNFLNKFLKAHSSISSRR